jgi:hypothetical protein
VLDVVLCCDKIKTAGGIGYWFDDKIAGSWLGSLIFLEVATIDFIGKEWVDGTTSTAKIDGGPWSEFEIVFDGLRNQFFQVARCRSQDFL